MSRRTEAEELAKFVVESIERGRASDKPFYHLQFDRIFPDDIYAAMLRAMPNARDYRALPGRHNENILEDGSATRVKIDLFPEYTRNLSPDKRSALTTGVGYLMMLSGVGKSLLVWKRRNPCPSCGRQPCGCER